MFYKNPVFNQPIGSWDTSATNIHPGNLVSSMGSMFENALAFNQPLSGWDTSKVTVADEMFLNAVTFNQNLANWDTGNMKDKDCSFVCYDFAKGSGCPTPAPTPETVTCGANFTTCEPGPEPSC